MRVLLRCVVLKRIAEFSVISINVSGLGKAFLLQASREEDIVLIAGLEDAVASVTVIDENASVLEVSSHFCCVDKMVKILLQTIDNGVPVKTILSIGGVSKQVSIIRLKVNSASFLVLCAPLKADELKDEEEFFRFMPELLPQRFT